MSDQFDKENNEYHFTAADLNQTAEKEQFREENHSAEETRTADEGQPVNHNPFDHTGQSAEQEPSGKKSRRAEKRKNKPHLPSGQGKKWAVVVCMAVVFGLIAGGVMFGVNTVGNVILGNYNKGTQIAQTKTTTGSDSSSSSSDSQGSVAEVAKNAMPSLVTISTMSVEEMRNFFGGTQQYEVQGAGTGVIVGKNDSELLIATNYHVVEGATSLSVGFIDEASVEGNIKGTDVNNDLAVVAVKLSDISDDTMNQIKVASIGDSDELQLGDQVVAIGNALGYGQSVTSGYVSALDRDLTLSYTDGTTINSTGLIQTDAAINSGNSGGALLNMKGELIGINEAKSSSSSSGASVDNIGFAIPIDKAQSSLQEMMNMETRQKVDQDKASYLGIMGSDVSSDVTELYGVPAGVVIQEVVDNGPAAQAGLKKGDIITAFDGRTVNSMTQLQDVLQYYASGEKVDLTIQRSDGGKYQEQKISVTLGSAQDAK